MLDRRVRWPAYTDMPRLVRSQHYRDEWTYYQSKTLFDILLTDGSLLQFKDAPEEHTDVSFCFYESPLAVEDYATFLTTTCGTTIDQVGDLGRDEYEAYLSSADLKRAVAMLRYDYSPGLYREGCHPASHIHVGHGTQVRLRTHRIMNPVSFTLFVLRQVYPLHWQKLIDGSGTAAHIKHVRESLPVVGPDFAGPKDLWELYLA